WVAAPAAACARMIFAGWLGRAGAAVGCGPAAAGAVGPAAGGADGPAGTHAANSTAAARAIAAGKYRIVRIIGTPCCSATLRPTCSGSSARPAAIELRRGELTTRTPQVEGYHEAGDFRGEHPGRAADAAGGARRRPRAGADRRPDGGLRVLPGCRDRRVAPA